MDDSFAGHIFAGKGKWENTSITVSKYLLPCIDDGKGPLRSIFSHWNGSMGFISVHLLLVMYFGFKYWQDLQEFVTLLICSKENRRFLVLVRCATLE